MSRPGKIGVRKRGAAIEKVLVDGCVPVVVAADPTDSAAALTGDLVSRRGITPSRLVGGPTESIARRSRIPASMNHSTNSRCEDSSPTLHERGPVTYLLE